jgi:hypothetical protein
MLAAVRDGALYEEIRKAGLQHHVWQWQSFAAFCQYRRVFEATRRYLEPGAVALDWGCGNGHFPFFLVRHGELVKLPFDESTFDLVFSIGVLEHVPEAGGSGHFLCFRLPNRYAWGENLRKVMKRLGAAEEFHPVLYTNRSFGDSIDAGLERLLAPFCQNWAFVLVKRPASTER